MSFWIATALASLSLFECTTRSQGWNTVIFVTEDQKVSIGLTRDQGGSKPSHSFECTGVLTSLNHKPKAPVPYSVIKITPGDCVPALSAQEKSELLGQWILDYHGDPNQTIARLQWTPGQQPSRCKWKGLSLDRWPF